eukprot:CAMPEP_0198656766 /NCGR_PEP_ID=MMETSP1467-20131203/10917_1 /TAXON_ID=1462469 /ORGANISM="unid. sp., Strain CCMP2135" /LENGTH=98 /DNA_ID=CAMNT_0044392839 /DNA_START=62 /DNA_END=358 /DNA_ORIENTATION=+
MAKKESILNLEKYVDQEVSVKFQGGREVRGVLKGFDQLVNVVLDDCIEYLRDPADPYRATNSTRKLGLVVCRGLQVSLVSPMEGTEEIANPFVAAAED